MRALALGLAGLVGIVIGGTSCLLDLDHAVACGDGYVDEAAGEDCDPAVRESFAGKCITAQGARDAQCDPDFCVLLDSDAACALCGNGDVDIGEECDPAAADIDSIAAEQGCVGLDAPYSHLPYWSGKTWRCMADCTWDRRDCGFCKNGDLDGALPIGITDEQSDLLSLPEWCEGDEFDEARLIAESSEACLQQNAVRNYACAANCLDYVERDGPECCLYRGAACPAAGSELRCCHEYAHPTADRHCADSVSGGEGGEPLDPGPLATCL
jgi:hypothetical protein